MKRILAFVLIICYLNTALFQTQLVEVDRYDAKGLLVDDINSVGEFFDEVVMGNVDETPEDEDDDTGDDCQVVKTVDLFFQYHFKTIIAPVTTQRVIHSSDDIVIPSLEVSIEIPYPPPEA